MSIEFLDPSEFEDSDIARSICGERKVELSAVANLVVALAADPDVLPDFLPEPGYVPKFPGDVVDRYIFRHPKVPDHGRKAWSVEMLTKTTYPQSGMYSHSVTKVWRRTPNGNELWVPLDSALATANHCPDCGVQGKGGKLVKGKYNEGVKCNARCMFAMRPDCECQCSGKNHGLGLA